VNLISTMNKKYSITTSNKTFTFNHIPEGKYKVIAFEKIVDFSDQYFPGKILPYRRAADFSIYDKFIEIRNHWTIKDIELIFE